MTRIELTVLSVTALVLVTVLGYPPPENSEGTTGISPQAAVAQGTKTNESAQPAFSVASQPMQQSDDNIGQSMDSPSGLLHVSETHWIEKAYVDDTENRVFNDFGSYDDETQAGVDRIFNEMLNDFAADANRIAAKHHRDSF